MDEDDDDNGSASATPTPAPNAGSSDPSSDTNDRAAGSFDLNYPLNSGNSNDSFTLSPTNESPYELLSKDELDFGSALGDMSKLYSDAIDYYENERPMVIALTGKDKLTDFLPSENTAIAGFVGAIVGGVIGAVAGGVIGGPLGVMEGLDWGGLKGYEAGFGGYEFYEDVRDRTNAVDDLFDHNRYQPDPLEWPSPQPNSTPDMAPPVQPDVMMSGPLKLK